MRKPYRLIPLIRNHERFFKFIRVNTSTDCWEWFGHKNHGGYGQFQIKNGSYNAHRVSYAIFKQQPDVGLVIDHICHNRICVNPEHLREVNHKTNSLENSESDAFYNHIKTHCKRGHEFTPENTQMKKTGRSCKACMSIYMREWRQKRKELNCK